MMFLTQTSMSAHSFTVLATHLVTMNLAGIDAFATEATKATDSNTANVCFRISV